MRPWLFVLAMLVAADRAAEADCGCLPRLSPESGTVPLHGTLYLGDVDLIEGGEIAVRWIGTPGTASWTVRDGIARLDYSGPEGSELVVVTFGRYEGARYKLRSSWRAPMAAPRATEFEHEESKWTCASTDALFIHLDQSTAAVRVRWTYKDTTRTLLLPTDGRVNLGRISCCGTYISPDELHDGGTMELVAIRVDGSEARISGVPSFVSSYMYGPAWRHVWYPTAREPDPDEPSVPRWLLGLLSLSLLGPLVYTSRRMIR